MNNSLQQTALNHIWYPCSQMKDYESLTPLVISKASGSYLYDENGNKIIDAISSWWCKSLGHQHPKIKQAIIKQLDSFDHIIGTNTVSQPLTQLSQKLAKLQPELNKVFYAGDGSCAIEVAMKMSLQARKILKQNKRNHFISLSNSYHGETIATLSVSDVGLYKKPYLDLCFKCTHINQIPYVNNTSSPLWTDASKSWPEIEKQLDKVKDIATAIIIEPILQGAGGMKIYSADFLTRLDNYAKQNDIHLISDEIMTGFGRTGKTFAGEHANIKPDFICLSKALTAGSLPMSAILTSTKIYDLFYDDYETGKAFLHSNTYGGNALAAAVANTVIDIHLNEDLNQQSQKLELHLLNGIQQVQQETKSLTNIRHIGAMVAADLNLPIERAGFKLFEKAIKFGAFLRPLGNTIYWLPPLNTSSQVINELTEITIRSIKALQ